MKISFKLILVIVAVAFTIIIAIISVTSTVTVSPLAVKQPSNQSSLQEISYGGPEIPSQYVSSSIVGIDGFADSGKLVISSKNDSQNSFVIPPVHDFVLKPGTSGHITIKYDYGRQVENSTFQIRDYITSYETSKEVTVVTEPSGWLSTIPANETGIRMYALPSDVKYSDNTAEVTYTIEAAASARRGTYVLPLPPFLVGQLITIGNMHYEGTLSRR